MENKTMEPRTAVPTKAPASNPPKATPYKDIPGWGMDADPRNEPTYPMKNYTGDDHKRVHWERPPLQDENIELLKSIEHPRTTAVFGTSTPPDGLSGAIRRYAYTFSESSYKRWLPLLLADRVDMVEGIIDDIRKGQFPNLFKEYGWTAEWKYNKKGVIKTAAIGIAAFVVVATIVANRRSSRKG